MAEYILETYPPVKNLVKLYFSLPIGILLGNGKAN